jgi:hypothetical protein
VIVGADLMFWAQVMRFAGSLVARQSFLPALELKGSSGCARWEPVYSGADAQRFARLAAAMPHACRALTNPDNIELHLFGVRRSVNRMIQITVFHYQQSYASSRS